MRVYVSGAITGVPREVARAMFVGACDLLAQQGHEPLNPYDVGPWAGCECPTDSQAGADSGHAWACYLRGDLAAMLHCDAIYLLPGWETSHGSRLELTVASAVGLRVMLASAGGSS